MSSPRPPLLVGLTGGIGSGKSTVAAGLQQVGATIIDADAISRELTATGGAALPAIAAAFGDGAIAADGALDRTHMRALVFADPDARHRLEAILHPMISAETERRAAAAVAAGSDMIVFDVPLLVESGRWRQRVHRVLVVDCEEDTQITRVMRRCGWSRGAVEAVLAQQASRAQRRAAADAVLYNEDCSVELLHEQVLALATHWRNRAN